jgi:hypothetical protein
MQCENEKQYIKILTKLVSLFLLSYLVMLNNFKSPFVVECGATMRGRKMDPTARLYLTFAANHHADIIAAIVNITECWTRLT